MKRLICLLFFFGCATGPISQDFIEIDPSLKWTINAPDAMKIYRKQKLKTEKSFAHFKLIPGIQNQATIKDPNRIVIKEASLDNNLNRIRAVTKQLKTGEYEIIIEPSSNMNQFEDLLRHELRHVLYGQMTYRQKNEVFASEK